ncbi:MAG TPA: type II secretion system F family protein [Pseudobdellovibrionaceae bacterium]|nr:type II secretion system F family protein [Pseudobdellovibrionaceae bacterium]
MNSSASWSWTKSSAWRLLASALRIGAPLDDALRAVEAECPDPILRPKFREAFAHLQLRLGEPLPAAKFSPSLTEAEQELLFVGSVCGTLDRAFEAAARIHLLRERGLAPDGSSEAISGPDQARAMLFLLLEQGVSILKALRFVQDEATALTPAHRASLMTWSAKISEGQGISSLCDPQLWGEGFARQIHRFETEGDLLALRENLAIDLHAFSATEDESAMQPKAHASLNRRLDFYLRVAANLESGEDLWNALWQATEILGEDRLSLAWRNWLREVAKTPARDLEIEAGLATCRFMSEREKIFFAAGLRGGHLPDALRSLASLGV